MKYEEAVELERAVYAQVFDRLPVLLTRGEAQYVFDDVGRRFLDFYSGIAVSAVGHSHPKVVSALSEQAGKLMHASNWVYTEPQLALAEKLRKLTGLERVFFANDGCGAVESAIKLARAHTGRKGIVSMRNSFHGRTMGALSATWQEKYKKPFMPLVPGFSFADYDNVDSLKKAITDDTAAVIVEPIQGEAGIVVPDDGYLQQVRELTQEEDVLLIVDEAQTGFGRTGHWFDFLRAKIEPDILVLAKGLGGGFPVSCIMYSGMDFGKGQHGGTFNGSPLACTAANAVIDVIEGEGLVENAKKMGQYLRKSLPKERVHGRGLMLGLDVSDGKAITLELIKRGLLLIYSGDTLRLLPPLTIQKAHADEAISALKEVI